MSFVKRYLLMLLLLSPAQIALGIFLKNYSGIIYAVGFLIGMGYQGICDIKVKNKFLQIVTVYDLFCGIEKKEPKKNNIVRIVK